MGKVKRDAGRAWGCIVTLVGILSGFVVGAYLYYKPTESNSKGLLDKSSEAFFIAITGAAMAVASMMGGWTDMSGALAIVTIADYISGVAAACMGKSKKTKSGGLSSKVGFYGIMKRVMMFGAIIVAHQVDIVASHGANTIRDIVTGCLIANDALSFYENVALFGVPFPKKLRRILDQIRDPEDTTPNDNSKGSASCG